MRTCVTTVRCMQRQHVDARGHADQEKGESRRRIEVGAGGMIDLGVARYRCVLLVLVCVE